MQYHNTSDRYTVHFNNSFFEVSGPQCPSVFAGEEQFAGLSAARMDLLILDGVALLIQHPAVSARTTVVYTKCALVVALEIWAGYRLVPVCVYVRGANSPNKEIATHKI